MLYTKKQLLHGMRYQLAHNPKKARKALILLYEAQTSEEKSKSKTVEHNEVGFTALDAEILTGIANFYLGHKFLTPRQDEVLKKLIPKYASQILYSSIGRGLIKQVSPRRWTILDRKEGLCYNKNVKD